MNCDMSAATVNETINQLSSLCLLSGYAHISLSQAASDADEYQMLAQPHHREEIL